MIQNPRRRQQQEGLDRAVLIQIIGFSVLLTAIIIGVVLTTLVWQKSKAIEARQAEVVKLMDMVKEEQIKEDTTIEVRAPESFDKDPKSGTMENYISKKEFEQFRKDYEREINRLKKQIQTVRALL